MFAGEPSDYRERVDVIGNKTFIEFVEQLEHEEDIDFETFEVGKDKLEIVTVMPDPAKLDTAGSAVGKDIALPVLSPILTRKKSLSEEIAALDVSQLKCPVLPHKQTDAAAQQFHYEGYDFITLQKLVEREYTIPEPQTAEEVIGYYARRIAQDLKLPSQFAALAPKVREFFETKAFGERVMISTPAMIKAMSSNVASYITVKTFVQALRELIIEEQEARLLGESRRLSETPAFPYSRPTLPAAKTVFNLVACDNEFEKEFARFLEAAPDVARFAKLPERFGFVIEYTDAATNLRYYEPDFVVVTDSGDYYLVETKGQVSEEVPHKNRAAVLWCENATILTGVPWAFLIVRQSDYNRLRPDEFADLGALLI
jgi:type III restriction enzyme